MRSSASPAREVTALSRDDGEEEALPDRDNGRWHHENDRPHAAPFTHYWRIVARLHDGKTEVFWGHASSAKEAARKEALTEQAAKRYGWKRFEFEFVELTVHSRLSSGG